jgi:hypothetical protein
LNGGSSPIHIIIPKEETAPIAGFIPKDERMPSRTFNLAIFLLPAMTDNGIHFAD